MSAAERMELWNRLAEYPLWDREELLNQRRLGWKLSDVMIDTLTDPVKYKELGDMLGMRLRKEIME